MNLTAMPSFEEHFIPKEERKKSKLTFKSKVNQSTLAKEKFKRKQLLKRGIHSNESFFDVIYENRNLFEMERFNIYDSLKKEIKGDFSNLEEIITSLVQMKWYRHLSNEIEEDKPFECFFFSGQKAWFHTDVDGHVRYHSRFDYEKVFALDVIDFVQLITKYRFSTLMRKLGTEFQGDVDRSSELIWNFNFERLGSRVSRLKTFLPLYKTLTMFHSMQKHETFQKFSDEEITFFINYTNLSIRLNTSRQYITKQINLLENYGILKRVQAKRFRPIEQKYLSKEGLQRNYETRTTSTMVRLVPLNDESTLHNIIKYIEAIHREGITVKEIKTSDVTVDIKKTKEYRIKQHLLKALRKGKVLSEQDIKRRWRNEKEIFTYFKQQKNRFTSLPEVNYRRLTKAEKTQYGKKDNRFYFILNNNHIA